MKKMMTRLLVCTLLIATIQPVWMQEKANAAALPDVEIPVEADKFADKTGGYPNGLSYELNPNALLVGYARDSGGDYGAANTALRFDLSDVNSGKRIESATLSIYVHKVETTGGDMPFIDLWGSYVDSWNEDISQALPAHHESIITNEVLPSTFKGWKSFDVTDFVKSNINVSDNKATFLLKGRQDAPPVPLVYQPLIIFYDKKNASYASKLEITYAANTPPTAILLTPHSIPENNQIGAVVGTLSATDPDPGETFTFSLATSESPFTIEGNQLKAKETFDFETKAVYSVPITVTDSASNTLNKNITVQVTDVNEPPTTATITINSGAAFANSANVTLAMTHDDPDAAKPEYRLSNVENGTWSQWKSFETPVSWSLSAGDGPKTVFMELRDGTGTVLQAQDSIVLDTTPPVIAGVANGGKYKVDVTPTFTDLTAMTATLNGNPFFTSGTTISQDGQYTLVVTDEAGNTTTVSFTIDKAAPVATVQINNGEAFTNQTVVSLNMTATDSNGVSMAFSNDGVSWSGLEPFAATKQWGLSNGEGNKTVHVKFVDEADNETIQTASVILDQTKPTGTFQINNGAAFTNSTTVELDTVYSDTLSPVEMSLSFDNLSWSTWEAAQSKKTVTLPAGDGVKTVYLKWRDLAGNEQAVVSDTIHLDTTAPTIGLSINAGATYTTSRQVTASISGSDANGPLEFRLANEDDTWTNWGPLPGMNWELTAGDGVKTVKLEVRDPAGNVSALSKTITLNTEGPNVTGVIDGGIYNSDVVISFDKGTATLNNASFTNNTTVSQEGTYKLIVTDIAGFETEVNFTIDKTAPSGSFTINNGAATTSSTRVNLSLTATDNLGQIEMRIANENEAWSSWQAYRPTTTWALPNGNGPKKVLLELRDEAGNVTSLDASIELRVSNPPPFVPVTSIELDEDSITLMPGETKKLQASIHPGNASNRSVNWSSSNPKIAEVNSWGEVTAKNPGTTTITVTTLEGQKAASAEVIVKAPIEEIPVTGVKLDARTLKLRVDQTKKLQATIQPSNATNQDVTWKSSDPAIASVDEHGEVTAMKPGKAIITVTTVDGKKTAEATVTVSLEDYAEFALSASESALWLRPGITASIHIYKADGNIRRTITKDPKVSYTPENDLVTVKDGRIKTGKKEGEVLITVSYQGEEITIPVIISKVNIRSLFVSSEKNAILEEDDEKQLQLFAKLSDGSSQELTELAAWTSNDPDVAKVTADGEIVAGEPGTAVITAKYSGKKVTVRVLVVEEKSPKKIKLSPSALNMKEGQTQVLKLIAEYEKGYDEIVEEDIEWEISDEEIAKVEDGKVTALNKGRTTLTAHYGKKSIKISISVK